MSEAEAEAGQGATHGGQELQVSEAEAEAGQGAAEELLQPPPRRRPWEMQWLVRMQRKVTPK